MSTILMRSDCKKFAPNIFNKSKCTNCFRQKEEHSAEALESNRATRKVSKCGYLFVAPGWDFSNPLNRTKRWQRRWFVLYDDGELNYSVDEHPETVPQASIDMNKVVEVVDAEEVTGNAFSLAIATPDRVHFVKGTCREEARWWADVLGVFPRSKGRHKRNATFPGSQTTSALLQKQPATSRGSTASGEPRPRFNSHSESTSTTSSSWRHVDDSDTIPTRDVISTPTPTPTSSLPPSSPEPIPTDNLRNDYRDQPASSGSPPTRDKIRNSRRPGGSGASSDSSKQQQRAALLNCAADEESRRALLDEYSDSRRDEKLKDIAASIVSPTRSSSCSSTSSTLSPRRVSSSSSIIETNGIGSTPTITSSNLTNSNNSNSELSRRETPTRDRHRSAPPIVVAVIDKPERDMTSTKNAVNSSTTRPPGTRTITTRTPSPAIDSTDHTDAGDKVRGDPDGCGLDLTSLCYSPGAELRVDLPSESLLNNKKGWLMKQHREDEWRKHWFVLRGLALMFYRDPTAEDKDILEGVIALSGIRAITEIPVARNYGFQLLSWDGRRYVLSAVTAGIRTNWMSALKKASGLEDATPSSPSPSPSPTVPGTTTASSGTVASTPTSDISPMGTTPPKQLGIGQPLEKELSSSQQRPCLEEIETRPPVTAPSNPVPASLPRSILFSSDEEYRTASEGGRRESGEWAEGLAPLPPSPPLNRTPISRVKEKARTRATTRCRVYKKSKPLPPTGKRIAGAGSAGMPSTATLCIPSSPECPLTTSELLPESDPDDISLEMSSGKSSIVDNQAAEICELKRELSLTLRDYSMAENELLRLRQHQMDVSSLENQVKQLLARLTNAERQLEARAQELTTAEALRESHAKLVNENEGLLAERRAQEGWRTRCLEQQQQFADEKSRLEHQLTGQRERGERVEALCHELNEAQQTIEQLRVEVMSLSERLAMGIEENEALYARLRELDSAAVQTEQQQRQQQKPKRNDSCASSNGSSARSMVGSLSDLTNIDLDLDLQGLDKDRLVDECGVLRGRFAKAVQEIRAMRRELRDAHAAHDQLELVVIGQRQEAKLREDQEAAQARLMVSRIDDLTLKLSAAEKQVRQLKHKLAKSESREKRRPLSLKGKESFQICKELEEKLTELETKINLIESGQVLPTDKKVVAETSSSTTSGQQLARSSSRKSLKQSRNGDKEKSTDEIANTKISSRLRRQSLDSATSSESLKVLIRMTSLENKVAKASKALAASNKNANNGIQLSIQLDSILNNCQNMINSIKIHSNIDYPQIISLEKCFSEVSTILHKYQKQFVEKESVASSVSFLQNLLKEKLISLAEKRRSLRDAGILDREASMRILAEKLAFESVLVGRLRQAIDCTSLEDNHFCANFHSQECERLMDVLEAKLRDEKTASTCESSVDQFTHLITSKLLAQRHLAPSVNSSVSSKERPGFEINPVLLARQRELNKKVSEYCEERLNLLAESLAHRGPHESHPQKEEPLREAWRVAQQTVNSELIQAEISHVTWRCGQNYEAALRGEVDLTTLCASDSHRALLQRWTDAADNALRQEMEEAARKLSARYHESVIDATDWSEDQSRASRRALEEYADIAAHKALINSRLQAICETATCVKQVAPTSETPPPESSLAQFLGDEHLTAEFQYLYRHYETESLASIPASNPSPSEILECLSEIHGHLTKAYSNLVNDNTTISPLPSHVGEPSWKTVHEQCSALGERMASLVVAAANYGSECRRCHQLQQAMDRMREQHERKLKELERNQQAEIVRVKDDHEREKKSLTTKYELEQQQARERAKLLERRLCSFDAENSPMDLLQDTYERSLREQHSFDENSSGDSLISSSPSGDQIGGTVRARYQFEIEQLRSLCEKGLITMENSHRRILAELDEKHRQELSQLRVEKEQALAEETQATLAALDAMRKAHETEVQKEITKFKSEFLQKMQATHDIGALHKQHEAEMVEIKQQILSLSQKYSDKCLESASLEDQLQLVNRQLGHAKQHIMQLESRNQQLRTQLRIEVSELSRGEMIAEKDVNVTSDEVDHHHRQEPHSPTKSHGVERTMLTISCLTDGVDQKTHSYWDKVHLLGTRRTGFERAQQNRNLAGQSRNEDGRPSDRKNARTASDLMKRPSEHLVKYVRPSDLPTNGLKGMVAERKKIFER